MRVALLAAKDADGRKVGASNRGRVLLQGLDTAVKH